MTELENSTKARNSSKLHIYFPSAIFTSAVALYRKDTSTIHINFNINYKNVGNFIFFTKLVPDDICNFDLVSRKKEKRHWYDFASLPLNMWPQV